MKIAIIGQGPTAVESALYFMDQDCSVSLFTNGISKQKYFNSIRGVSDLLPTSKFGVKKLGVKLDSELEVEEYAPNYFEPIWNFLLDNSIIRDCKVKRISKSHIAYNENIPGRSRLADLFRVTFEMNAEKLVEQQLKLNEEAFNNVSLEALSSLKKSIEMAEDYDLILVASDIHQKNNPIGVAGSPCLNEEIHSSEEYFFHSGIRDFKSEVKSVALFGDGNGISHGLAFLQDWLKLDKNNKLYVLSKNKSINSLIGQTNSTAVNEVIKKIQIYLSDYNEAEEKRLSKALDSWKNLEDYVRAKHPRPEMKPPQIEFLPNMNAVSIDQLDGRDTFYLTLEPGKNDASFDKFLGLKTISVESILNMMPGLTPEGLLKALNIDSRDADSDKLIYEDEPGFYSINKNQLKFDLNELNENLDLIINDIKKYFSKN